MSLVGAIKRLCIRVYEYIRGPEFEPVEPSEVGPATAGLIKEWNILEMMHITRAYTKRSDLSHSDFISLLNEIPAFHNNWHPDESAREHSLAGTPYFLYTYSFISHLEGGCIKKRTKYYWFYYLEGEGNESVPTTFENVLDNIPEEIAEQLLFHLELFI